ncbi:MAG: hypothetical protein Q9213_002786 [Squamulea squamosa]
MPTETAQSASDNGIHTSSTDNVLDTLREACTNGQTEEARDCLNRWRSMEDPIPPRPPRKPTVHLQPALFAAVEKDHTATASLLLDEGFLVEHEAVRAALANRSTAMLQVFLDHGWNINKKLGPTMAPALTRTLDDEELVRWFLAHGADPNAAVQSWPSPLEAAAFKAPLEVIKILVDHGGRVYPSNALPQAAKTALPDRTEILAYFLDKGAPIDMVEYEFDKKTFQKFGVKAFGTALHQASKRGNEQLVQFLLQRGAEPSVKDSVGKTALQYAQENDHQGVVSLLGNPSAIWEEREP